MDPPYLDSVDVKIEPEHPEFNQTQMLGHYATEYYDEKNGIDIVKEEPMDEDVGLPENMNISFQTIKEEKDPLALDVGIPVDMKVEAPDLEDESLSSSQTAEITPFVGVSPPYLDEDRTSVKLERENQDQGIDYSVSEYENIVSKEWKEHGRNIFPCLHCDYKTSNGTNLREHIKSVHEGQTFPCPSCNKEFT